MAFSAQCSQQPSAAVAAAAATPPPPGLSESDRVAAPGSIVEGGALEALERAVHSALSSAASFSLCRACHIDVDTVAGLGCDPGCWPPRPVPGVTPMFSQQRSWNALTKWRIRRSFCRKDRELLWLFDKVDQPRAVRHLAGEQLHLPTLVSASLASNATSECNGGGARLDTVELRAVLERRVARGEACVLKPINGAGGQHVKVWRPRPPTGTPQQASADADDGEAPDLSALAQAAAVDELVEAAQSIAQCGADLGEPWQILQTPRGVIVQPLYQCGVAITDDLAAPGRASPLELKLHVLFGVVLGGTLHTHPWNLWVCGQTGRIHMLSRESRKGAARAWPKSYGRELSAAALSRLCGVLSGPNWDLILAHSTRIAAESG
jgi:hypothetical protein